jgi:folate-binding protein YgfZ
VTQGWAVPITRDVLWIEGPDAAKFLQGQLSQDIDALAVGDSAASFVLQPKGKIASWGSIARVSDQRYAFVVAAGWGQLTVDRLSRFLLRTDATMTVEEDVQGFAARDVTAEIDTSAASVAISQSWGDALGVDVLGCEAPADLAGGSPAQFERRRIESMVPVLGAELDDSVIPGEAGPAFVEASVSFTKGCYVGQELVARVHSRGDNTPRKLRVVSFDGTAPVGAPLSIDGSDIGTITSVVPAEAGQSVGLAFVSRTALDATAADLAADGGPVRALLSDRPLG